MTSNSPEVFSLPVVLCPHCQHGIDPHGLDPGGRCGVGNVRAIPCECMWSPNDIAATLLARAEETVKFWMDFHDQDV